MPVVLVLAVPAMIAVGVVTGYYLTLLWQILAIDRRYWIPESGFQ